MRLILTEVVNIQSGQYNLVFSRSGGVYSIEAGAGEAEVVCSRPCILHLLLAPCSTCTTMAHNKIRRLLLLGLGITTFILGEKNLMRSLDGVGLSEIRTEFPFRRPIVKLQQLICFFPVTF